MNTTSRHDHSRKLATVHKTPRHGISSFRALRRQVFSTSPNPPDIVVGFSATTLQAFLDQHYTNNPSFYDRSRTSGNPPIFDQTFDDHGTPRRVRLWAKVNKDHGQHAVSIFLTPAAATQARFQAWWAVAYGAGPGNNSLPHNVTVSVPDVTLQVNFPMLDGTGGEYQLDIPFRVEVETFIKVVQSADDYDLQLVNWDITLTGLADPLDPGSPVWGAAPPPACAQEIIRLRYMIRDMVTLGANIALTQLASTLVVNLPLPPLDIVKGVSVVPQELSVTNASVSLGFLLQASNLRQQVTDLVASQLTKYNASLAGTDINKILSQAPQVDGTVGSATAFENYLMASIPAYAELTNILQGSITANKILPHAGQPIPASPAADLFIMLDGSVFDLIAKTLLRADSSGTTNWLDLDIAIGYFKGRARYWLDLSNGQGALNGTTISMGAQLDAGGALDLQACVRIPCHPDECGSWSPGLGLKGPCAFSVTVDNADWDNNQALKLVGSFDSFPGFVVYGLPPVVGNIANTVIQYLSSVLIKAFFNSILSLFGFYVVKFPTSLGHSNVNALLSNFGISNQSGFLVLTESVDYS